MKWIGLVAVFFFMPKGSFSQLASVQTSPTDSSWRSAFTQAHWSVSGRSFFMQTVQQGSLKDDFIWANGYGLALHTKAWKGWQLNLSGFYMTQSASSAVAEVDPTTHAVNRYEAGMLDITDLKHTHNMVRWEEMNLSKSGHHYGITWGRMGMNNPFFNAQDGRMRPTLVEGIHGQWNVDNTLLKIEGSYIYGVSPRSTTRWYSLSESVGLYPQGMSVSGNKSDYAHHLPKTGMLIFHMSYHYGRQHTIQVWDGNWIKVMNTVVVENKMKWGDAVSNLQWNTQYHSQQGKQNSDGLLPSQVYTQADARAQVVSTQLIQQVGHHQVSLSYTHIARDGRYLMPREWGRDYFYTFMPRERNEGLASVNAWIVRYGYMGQNKKWKTSLACGEYHTPEPSNVVLNKYSLPSYMQANWDLTWVPGGRWQGLECRMLIAGKMASEKQPAKYQVNRVNLVNINFVVDFNI